MEKEIREKLLESIKNDDAARFGERVSPELYSVVFGRFSLLSLLYLYDAKRIIKRYLAELLRERPRIREPAFYEAETLFRKKAGKTLRHFSDREISPLEMLAALGKRRELKRLYPLYPNHVRFLANINRIWLTRTGKELTVKKDKLSLPAMPLSFAERRLHRIFAPIFLGMGVAFLAVTLSLSAYFGWGTSKVYYKAHSGGELLSALSQNDFVLLEKDLSLSSGVKSYASTIEGAGHVVRLKQPLTDSFSGEIRDVTFVLESGFRGDAVILENTGTLTNVRVIAQGRYAKGGEYMSLLTSVNKGKIENCTATFAAEIAGDTRGDCFYAAFAGSNEGIISNCIVTGSVTARNVDVAGIAGNNSVKGEIKDCVVDATLTENSDLWGWTPNVAGIVCHNEGSIEGCTVSGSVTSVLNGRERCTESRYISMEDTKLRLEYCDCDSFSLFRGSEAVESALAADTTNVSDSLVNYYDYLSAYYYYFINTYVMIEGANEWQLPIVSGNPYTYNYYYNFVSYAKNIFDNSELLLTKNVGYTLDSGAVIGLNEDFTITYGSDRTLADFRAVIAELFGFSDAEEFLDCASRIADAYQVNALGAALGSVSERLKYKGAIYTQTGAFFLPFVWESQLSDTPVLAFVIVEEEGRISVWLQNAEAAFKATNYDNAIQKEEIAAITLYGRCSLFEPNASAYAAGVVCVNVGSVKECTNRSAVTANAENGSSSAGGIVAINTKEGSSRGVINRCSGLGEVMATSTTNNSYAGGIAAQNMSDCYIIASRQLASVLAQSEGSYYDFTGGIVGDNSGGIQGSFFIGTLEDGDEDSLIGAICGMTYLYYGNYTNADGNAYVKENVYAFGALYDVNRKVLYGLNAFSSDTQYLLDYGATPMTLDELRESEIYYE